MIYLMAMHAGEKKGKDDNKENIPTTVDQSALQYYIILGLQDFYQNHFLPLRDENITLKEELDKTGNPRESPFSSCPGLVLRKFVQDMSRTKFSMKNYMRKMQN